MTGRELAATAAMTLAVLAVGCTTVEAWQGVTELTRPADAEVAVVPPDDGALAVVPSAEPELVAPQEVVAPPPAVVADQPAPPPPAPRAAPPPRPKDPYLALRWDLDRERELLALRRSFGQVVHEEASQVLDRRLPQFIEAWKGTRWSYSGTTQTPKKGAIACGYYISTVLQHAGFGVDRVDLARQASEQIIRTLVPDDEIARFRWHSNDKVVRQVEQMGPGVYLAGLDTHIGFLVQKPGKAVQFCHSTKRNGRIGVICENPRTSPSFKSRYHVIGKLGSPELAEAWVKGEKLPTARKFEPQPVALNTPVPLLRPPPFSPFEL